MKKSRLLHSDISSLISRLGHTDSLVIGDAGLPVPAQTQRIDLALTHGVPGFLSVVDVVTSEIQVERALLADEIKHHNPQLHEELLRLFGSLAQQQGNPITVDYVSHEQFKQHTQHSRGVVRTGECSPYANVILFAGVTF
ncbi:D-ribose pyranase [Enterobacteriaceae bacterium LUAb1]